MYKEDKMGKRLEVGISKQTSYSNRDACTNKLFFCSNTHTNNQCVSYESGRDKMECVHLGVRSITTLPFHKGEIALKFFENKILPILLLVPLTSCSFACSQGSFILKLKLSPFKCKNLHAQTDAHTHTHCV